MTRSNRVERESDGWSDSGGKVSVSTSCPYFLLHIYEFSLLIASHKESDYFRLVDLTGLKKRIKENNEWSNL